MQLPKGLPALDTEAMKDKAADGAQQADAPSASRSAESSPRNSRYRPSRLEELPDGRLGKIQIHQSGKVKLKMGNHVFDVNQGSECNFAQEVGCHLESNNEFIFLGKCSRRIMLVPDIANIIKVSEREAPSDPRVTAKRS
eukprot:Selendium_serpulae@DN3064_c0_g1_i1.p1